VLQLSTRNSQPAGGGDTAAAMGCVKQAICLEEVFYSLCLKKKGEAYSQTPDRARLRQPEGHSSGAGAKPEATGL
jgi:hypothetical protein